MTDIEPSYQQVRDDAYAERHPWLARLREWWRGRSAPEYVAESEQVFIADSEPTPGAAPPDEMPRSGGLGMWRS